MLRWATRSAPFAAMALVTLVLAHNLVFLVGHGTAYREALFRSGHGDAWTMAVATVLVLGLALVVAAGLRLRQLSRAARAIDPGLVEPPRLSALLRGLASLWLRLASGGGMLFVAQENAEHLGAGDGLRGLAVLTGSAHAGALAVIVAVALAVALVGQLFRSRHDLLTARIAAARRPWRGAAIAIARPHARADRRPPSVLGHRLAPRAPPLA